MFAAFTEKPLKRMSSQRFLRVKFMVGFDYAFWAGT
jgi:hypothetical protein